MQVMKFGGTSVADAAAIDRVIEIVSRAPDSRFVVVSALAGVTDALVDAVRLAGAGNLDAALGVARALRERHLDAVGLVRDRARRDAAVRVATTRPRACASARARISTRARPQPWSRAASWARRPTV